MSKKVDYTAEEWKAIASAPVMAGLYVSMSDKGGPAGIAKEAIAVVKAIADSGSGDAPEVVKALSESVKSSGGRPELPDLPTGDPAATQQALIGGIKTAVAAVASKSSSESDDYKAWLVSVATAVSHASKEGGFLGFGGAEVSRDEETALRQLSDALGVSGKPRT